MSKSIRAHMPGIVQEILVGPGDAFAAGDTVAWLESMKMQIPVEAPEAGTVTAWSLKAGDVVDEDGAILTYS